MGRTKGSKNKPKEKEELTSRRVVQEETTFLGQGPDGPTPVKLVQEVERYTFRNLGPSMYYVTADFSNDTKQLPPGTTRDDFTKKERVKILTSTLYKAGQVIEELHTEVEESYSPNSLNDRQLDKLMLMDNDEIKEHIFKMDSIFALNRVKERIIDQGLPAHLTAYIDSRIAELQAQYEEEHKAPIDGLPREEERRV
jgi:hypothetical protein